MVSLSLSRSTEVRAAVTVKVGTGRGAAGIAGAGHSMASAMLSQSKSSGQVLAHKPSTHAKPCGAPAGAVAAAAWRLASARDANLSAGQGPAGYSRRAHFRNARAQGRRCWTVDVRARQGRRAAHLPAGTAWTPPGGVGGARRSFNTRAESAAPARGFAEALLQHVWVPGHAPLGKVGLQARERRCRRRRCYWPSAHTPPGWSGYAVPHGGTWQL